MKIIINTSILRFGGAVQVALSFIQECRSYTGNDYHVFLGEGVGKLVKRDDFPVNFHFYDTQFGEIALKKIPKIQRTLSNIEKEINPDVVITTSGPSYWKSMAPQIMGYNLPLYIYPESPYVQKLSINSKMRLWLKKLLHVRFFKRDAVAWFVQTDDVNTRVRSLFNTDRVYTISNTCNGFFRDWSRTVRFLPDKADDEVRLLTPTAWYDHKNLDLIPDIIDELKNDSRGNIRFVLTLPEEVYLKKIPEPYRSCVVTVGYVKPIDLPSLYDECDMMFLPTLAECFSASYPEAMVMGKPIITTDLGFAKSICGEAAVYFKPSVARDAAEKILSLINDEPKRAALIQHGYRQLEWFDSPRTRAEKLLNLAAKYKQRVV